LLVLCIPLLVTAQSSQHEVAVTNTIIKGQNFGLLYRNYINDAKRIRIGLTHLGVVVKTTQPSQPSEYRQEIKYLETGAELGLEKIVLTEGRLSVYLGAGIKYNLSAENNRTNNPSIPIRQQSVTSTTSSYGVTFFSGLAVNLSEHIFTNFDISPHLMYYRTKNSYFPGGNSGFDFSFQPDVFRLMLGYRLNH
ncbi:MAG: hypothetical protein OEX02_17575, partial [Cyclobacteriaceae bacterium]|nr:hypothetical protein [Cyclobacteriaceae bacterium]